MQCIYNTFIRWFQFKRRASSEDYNEQKSSMEPITECYACTQVGVPVFHSTSCDSTDKPEWQASAGSSLIPISAYNKSRTRVKFDQLRSILDPRSTWVKKWNKVTLLVRGITLAVDPLFFYALSLSLGIDGAPCLHMDFVFALIVTVVRTALDVLYLWHIWLQFRLAYVSRESLVVGCGKLVWDAKSIAWNYVKSLQGFWLDLFVILPIPQVVLWGLIPNLIKDEKVSLTLTILLVTFLFQYLPKIYHSFCLVRKMRKVTGYIFGSIWWGFSINIIAYLIASHATGGCWYVLATKRVFSCLKQQCEKNGSCNLCPKDVCYRYMYEHDKLSNSCGKNVKFVEKPMCLDDNGPFVYGLYSQALLVVTSNSLAVKIFFPIYWGLFNLSSFANQLEPTSNVQEVLLSIFICICGLALFIFLIGNFEVFLRVVMSNRRKMQLRSQDLEWWMRRRQLPPALRERVRHFEHRRWAATMGTDSNMDWIEELPEGLRRDINRYICLDLIRKVPLFHSLDDLVLDNICDRAKTLFFSKGEKIIREGDPVGRMMFIMRGRVERSQSLGKGRERTAILEPGGFLGDELLSWCLRRPFIENLPASSATFTCTKSTEMFYLDYQSLKYITDHFRNKFANEKLKRTMRYYSSNWRTWAAVNIQLAWRRYRRRRSPVDCVVVVNGDTARLRLYAAMFMSLKPHDHLD